MRRNSSTWRRICGRAWRRMIVTSFRSRRSRRPKTLKDWLRKFGLVCGTISVAALRVAAQPAPQQEPALVVFDPGDLAPWQSAAAERGWRVIVPAMAADSNIDTRVQTVDKTVLQAIQDGSVDP